MTVSERFAVEEFDVRYKNIGKLRIALKYYPGFDSLKPVTAFTAEEKVNYIRIIRFIEEVTAYKQAVNDGIVPMIDFFDESFNIPNYVDRDYFYAYIA